MKVLHQPVRLLHPVHLIDTTEYMQYSPITNGGVRVRGGAAICYRTILCVPGIQLEHI